MGCEARIVGGAVRDWLLATGTMATGDDATSKGPADIDMAIACPIADAAAALRRRKLKIVETGLAHGTITVLGDGAPIELTQTRVDLETDGRHAVIGFTDDWAEDARRRDFTVNALYVTEDGRLEDPIGGLPDLMAGRLRFVGDARTRIAEDGLRMLRYCRFLPRFGEGVPTAKRLKPSVQWQPGLGHCQESALPVNCATCLPRRGHSQGCRCCTIPALIRPFWGCACNRMRWHYCHLMMPSSRRWHQQRI